MARSRGTTLALLGVGLFVAMLVAGVATAPDRAVAGGATSTPALTPAVTDTVGPGTPGDSTPTRTPPAASPRTLVGVQGGWVKHGNVRLYSGSDEVWRETSADGYFEVSMLPDGTVLAAFANETATDCGTLESPCAVTGYRHIDPDAAGGPDVVAEYTIPVGSLTNSEVHAVDRIDDGEYVFTDMDAERVVVVENGTETWEWRASSFYEAPADPTSRDWLHINDVDVIDEDRFLVSVRNANQLVVVERGAGVVEVINEDDGGDDETCLQGGRLQDQDGDGDVRCGDPDVIQEQHNPQWIGPGAVLVADSENDRVVELHETADGDWEPRWVVSTVEGVPRGTSLNWPRDADRLPNGNTLITDSLNERVVEVNPAGEVVWWTVTGESGRPQIPYEADRLPVGEFAGRYAPGTTPNGTETPGNGTATPGRTALPTANGTGDLDAGGREDIPFLTLAITGMRGTFGWLPFWFSEFDLAVTILSVGLVVAGGLDHWRNPGRTLRFPDRES